MGMPFSAAKNADVGTPRIFKPSEMRLPSSFIA
jgi:hypothetical protein